MVPLKSRNNKKTCEINCHLFLSTIFKLVMSFVLPPCLSSSISFYWVTSQKYLIEVSYGVKVCINIANSCFWIKKSNKHKLCDLIKENGVASLFSLCSYVQESHAPWILRKSKDLLSYLVLLPLETPLYLETSTCLKISSQQVFTFSTLLLLTNILGTFFYLTNFIIPKP